MGLNQRVRVGSPTSSSCRGRFFGGVLLLWGLIPDEGVAGCEEVGACRSREGCRGLPRMEVLTLTI